MINTSFYSEPVLEDIGFQDRELNKKKEKIVIIQSAARCFLARKLIHKMGFLSFNFFCKAKALLQNKMDEIPLAKAGLTTVYLPCSVVQGKSSHTK